LRKGLEESSDFEELRRYYEEQYGETLGKEDEEYLKIHLKGMDEVEKAWYLHSMKTWTKKDYDNYLRFHLWILGDEGERGDGMSFLADAIKMIEENNELSKDEKEEMIQMVKEVCEDEEITREDEDLKELFQENMDDTDDLPPGGEVLPILGFILLVALLRKKLRLTVPSRRASRQAGRCMETLWAYKYRASSCTSHLQ